MNMYLYSHNPIIRMQNALKLGWSAILFIALWLGISLSVWAQPQYNFTAVSGTFTSIVGQPGAVNIPDIEDDDEISTALPIGFSFTYNGVAYTQFKASSNGWMTFNTATTGNANFNDLSGAATAIRPILAPLWEDLDGTTSGVATYLTSGAPGSQVFTMEWLNWEWNYEADVAVISFQVKLYQATGVIEYIYRQEAAPITPGFSGGASIGLTTATGTGANSYLSLNNASASPTVSSTTETNSISTKPATGQIYRFIPKLFNTTPVDNATGVVPNANLVITFLSGMPAIGTGSIQIRKTSDNSVVETITLPSAQVEVSGSVVTINPNVVLDCNTEYYVNVPASAVAGVTGFAGITSTTAWSFTTGAPTGTINPTTIVTLLNENFSTATGSTPPVGWVNNIILGDPTVDTWRYNNPGNRLASGFTAPFAIFDSDNYSSNFPINTGAENVALESPTFDASTVGRVYTLSFKHFFLGGFNGSYNVEVFNGTAWVSVLSGTTTVGSGAAPITESINISTAAGSSTAAKVRFRWIGDYSFYWLVDDVKVTSGVPGLSLTATFTPLDEAINVPLNSNLVLNFNYPVSAGTGDITIRNATTNTILETIAATAANVDYSVTGQVTINPTNDLPAGVPIAVQFPTGTFKSCNDLDIIGILDNTTWNFITLCTMTADAGVDQSVANNSTVNLLAAPIDGTGPFTYLWSPAMDLSSTTVANPTISTFTTTTTYTVTITDANGCTASDQVVITNLCDASTLAVNAGVDQTAAVGSSVSLDATPSGGTTPYTYLWSPATGLSSTTVEDPTITSFSGTATYTLTVTDGNGCVATDQVTITNICTTNPVSATLTNTTIGNQANLGDSFDITVTPGTGTAPFTYAWSTGATTATITEPSFAGSTVYTVAITDANGCTASRSVLIITVGSGGGSSTPPITVRAPSIRVTSTGSSTMRLDFGGGDADQYRVFRRNESIGNSFSQIALLGSGATQFLDSMLMPNTRYSYYIQGIRQTLVANSNTVSDYTYPSVPIVISSQDACVGSGGQLLVGGSTGTYNVYASAIGGSIIARGDSTGVILTPTFTDSTTFYVSAIGTRYESSPRVAVRIGTKALPIARMLGTDLQESCSDSVTIMAESVDGASYTWYSSESAVATTAVPMYTVTRSGVYSVLVTKDGCTARSGTIRVRTNRISPARIIGLSDRQFCESGVLNVVTTDSATYEWQRNNVVVGTGSSLEVTQSGTYTVTVTSILGCVLTSESVNVSIISVPSLDLQSSSSDFCAGTEGVELSVNAVNGARYEWLRSGRRVRITSIPSLQTNIGGEYRVRVILNGNCSRTSESVTITRNAAPVASSKIYGDSIKVIYSGNVEIESITWTKDGAPFSATTQAFSPTESGLYIATVTYTTGCQVVSSGVNYIKRPEPPVVTGEQEVEALGFALYPNPTSSQIYLAFGDAFKGNLTLTLSDAIGRRVQVVKVKSTDNAVLDLSTLASGSYMLTISSEDKVVTRKIVRE